MSAFEWKVAWRFLISGRGQTMLILLGIIVGVGVQVFLGSLIGGLQANLIEQTVGSSPHITIEERVPAPRPIRDSEAPARVITFDGRTPTLSGWQNLEREIRNEPLVTAVSPTLLESAFVARGQKTLPVQIRGIELEKADGIYQITERLVSGQASLSGNGILLGVDLAEELVLKVGDSLVISRSEGESDRFEVRGVFDLGNQTLNSAWILMAFPRARAFLQAGDGVNTIEIQIADVFGANGLADAWQNAFANIQASSWQRTNAQLLTALNSQSSSSLMIQFFVLVAVTLGISSVLAVSVVQRSKQIGILKAMGIRTNRIGRIFLYQGMMLGSLGALLGVAAGTGLSQAFVFFVRDEMGRPLFPIEADPVFMLISAIIATAAGMVAALIPARNSAKLSPIEVIRNG